MSKSCKSWTDEDIDLLDRLLRVDLSIKQIAKVLGRSERATEHAVSKMVYHQLVSHTPQEIADRYNKDVQWVANEVVDPKYYVTHGDTDDEYSCAYMDGDGESDCCGDEIDCTSPVSDGTTAFLSGMIGVFALTTMAGAAYWGYLLMENGFATCPYLQSQS